MGTESTVGMQKVSGLVASPHNAVKDGSSGKLLLVGVDQGDDMWHSKFCL